MNAQSVLEIGQGAIETTLLLSAPLLVTALVIGLVVSILQAATQINESTLSFIPKLVGIFAALVLAGPWMVQLFVDYMQRLFASIPHVIG